MSATERQQARSDGVFTAAEPATGLARVLTMNVWNFSGDYNRRQALLRAGISDLQPDLLAFQEAGCDGERDQVRDMLEGLDYHVIHQFDALPELPGTDGCALASRWPVELLELVSLTVSPHSQSYPYAALVARAHAPTPIGPLLLVSAKPSWELHREYERELQALALVKAVVRHADPAGSPPVIAGDFDARPDSASIRFLTGKQSLGGMSVHFRDAWTEAGDGTPGYTWTYRNGSARGVIAQHFQDLRHERRIDYILVGSPHDYALKACIRKARVVLDAPEDGIWPSDHYAVYAEIEVTP